MKSITASLIVFTATVGAQAQSASGVYDPSTGDISLTIGSGIGVVGIESLSGGALRPSSLSDALAAVQATPDVIAFFSATGLSEGSFDLGPIVAAQTPVSDLGFAYTPIGGQQVVSALTVVPEPGAAALAAVGGLLLVRRRR